MKKALIIGGSRGIGLGLVKEYMDRGWHVTATERRHSAELHQLADSVPARLVIDHLDIRVQDQQRDLAQRLAGQSFDLLFLNAGVLFGRAEPLDEISDERITDQFMTNAVSPVRTADALHHLVHPDGMIAFMSSKLGSVSTNADGRAELYRASKAALNTLVLSFHARHANDKRSILILHPGVVRTEMGGANAPLDIQTSVSSLADVIDKRWGEAKPVFVDYQNQTIPW